jgi:mRNA-degrading endonuclease toxin of MazEF toxin-antitoxin module
MKPRQWDIWKCKPPGFEREHWFVIISGQERCDASRMQLVNGLACFTLRGSQGPLEVRLNGADGFDLPTVCQCDFIYPLPKSMLHSPLGQVCWERQQQIKSRVKEILRF